MCLCVDDVCVYVCVCVGVTPGGAERIENYAVKYDADQGKYLFKGAKYDSLDALTKSFSYVAPSICVRIFSEFSLCRHILKYGLDNSTPLAGIDAKYDPDFLLEGMTEQFDNMSFFTENNNSFL